MMEMAVDPGMETPSSHNIHQSVVHHAALADMLTTAIRRPKDAPWGFGGVADMGKAGVWHSSAALLAPGPTLSAITFVSSWNDERHYSTVRSWFALGEVAHYEVPMKMVVVILGQHRDGRRTGPWTRGFLHPRSHQLLFRKKSKVTSETFSDSWEQVWREDRGDISNTDWQQAMLNDDILRDVLFTIDIPVPGKLEIQRIREMAARKLERLEKMKAVPEASMSVCDRPPCQFRGCCWSAEPYEPSEKAGFVAIADLTGHTLGHSPKGL